MPFIIRCLYWQCLKYNNNIHRLCKDPGRCWGGGDPNFSYVSSADMNNFLAPYIQEKY